MQAVLDPSKIAFKGWMEKCGGNVKNWKKRLFVISDLTMYYFKDQQMTEELGRIPLIDTTLTEEPETDGPGFYFKIHFPPNSTAARSDYLCRCPTEAERTEWIEAISKASKLTVFNRPLLNALKINPENPQVPLPIPYFIKAGVDYLNAHGLRVEGIYRLNGSGAQIEMIQKQIDKNEKVTYSDVHSATGLIKMYLRTIPDPILLKKNYSALQAIVLSTPESEQYEPISQIIRSIPLPNYLLLHYIYKHLINILQYVDENKMSERALGVCIGPSILAYDGDSANAAYSESTVQQGVSTVIFQNFAELFGDNPLMRYRPHGTTSMYRLKKAQNDYPYILQAPANAIVQSVTEDSTGWYVCVYNDQWGVLHNSMLEPISTPYQLIQGLSNQDKKWMLPEDIKEKFQNVCPDAETLYQALFDKLNEYRRKAKSMSK